MANYLLNGEIFFLFRLKEVLTRSYWFSLAYLLAYFLELVRRNVTLVFKFSEFDRDLNEHRVGREETRELSCCCWYFQPDFSIDEKIVGYGLTENFEYHHPLEH